MADQIGVSCWGRHDILFSRDIPSLMDPTFSDKARIDDKDVIRSYY